MEQHQRVSARSILDQYEGAPSVTTTTTPPGPGRFPRRALLGGGTLAAAGITIGTALAGGASKFTPAADLSGLPVVNITDAPFKADPTGSADSTKAIVAAIAAAGTNGRVYAPAGTYLISSRQNGGSAIVFTGDGVFEGAGRQWSNPNQAATTFRCTDAAAGFVFNGSGVVANFTVDGAGVAKTPLQRGTQSDAAPFGTFMQVAVINSAQDGWTIISSQNDSYYNCVSHGSARDNLYIDGGAGGLDFFHWSDSSSGRYGIHSDGLITGLVGSYADHTEAIRFWGGASEVGSLLGLVPAPGVSRIYLRHAVDWAFPTMNIYGLSMSGPTVHIDQGTCYAINLSDALIWANKSLLGASPGHACIQIDGTAGFGGDVMLNGTYCVEGDTSVYIASGTPTVSAVGLLDHTTNGPVGAPGLPEVNSLLMGRTGPWLTASLLSGWTGSAAYRFTSLGEVEMKGAISGPSGTPAFTVPAGYRPPKAMTLLALMGAGVGSVSVTTPGTVTPTLLAGVTAGPMTPSQTSDATTPGTVTPTQAPAVVSAQAVTLDGLSYPTT
ncbi:MAG TPA: glycosyl hydrolase family 28-related protein [Acidimicrobiales bacterium]|jgi:hypothetical protein